MGSPTDEVVKLRDPQDVERDDVLTKGVTMADADFEDLQRKFALGDVESIATWLDQRAMARAHTRFVAAQYQWSHHGD